ncbi:argininosuccinate lyase [Paenibacillus aestuarii]|uniref:Argininosuccinate lyase n=1 Tax=Paenibacillus aestuarii TaxID=516965 RepID=A0ABW0K952_9BACL|nr:argininosuccinate lyase [Paenibacillus aestuarii]
MIYNKVVLEPAYRQAQAYLLEPMIAIHKAHLIMLHQQGLIDKADAGFIASALLDLNLDRFLNSTYTGEFEDLFFEMEHELLSAAGDTAGNLHIGRSRNDMGIALYRMVLRDKILEVIESALILHKALLAFAAEHVDTIYIALTHTQQAQPTTIAHYISAAAYILERDIKRFKNAYDTCNVSSLGAAALTTSGYPLDRELVAELLGFAGLIENSYDAVSAADYAGEAAAASQLASANAGRFVQDLLQWCTQEFGVLRLADDFVQISSIMPQKRNPVGLEHARSLLSSCIGNAQTVFTLLHNTPYGDIVDTEDDMQPYIWKSLETLSSVYRLLAAIISTASVDRVTVYRRAKNSFATVTELADTLVRIEGLSFRKAHEIVGEVVGYVAKEGHSVRGVTLQALNDASVKAVGRKLRLTEMQLQRALDPEHFVRIRSLRGGPSSQEVMRALKEQALNRQGFEEWHDEKLGAIRSTVLQLDHILVSYLPVV